MYDCLTKKHTISIIITSEVFQDLTDHCGEHIKSLDYATRAWDSPLKGNYWKYTSEDLDRLEADLHKAYQKTLERIRALRQAKQSVR